MLEANIGRIRVFSENDLGTVCEVLFKTEFDPNNAETTTYKIRQRDHFGLYLKLDIYKPVQRQIDELERDNADLQDLVDEMAATIERLEV